jgi:hypothetical protein
VWLLLRFERLDIREVLRTLGRPPVLEESFQPDDRNSSPVQLERGAIGASSNVIPSARLRISIRRGGSPICRTPSYVAKSFSVTSNDSSRAPKAASAR